MDKKEIIHAMEEISSLLELKGEDKFKTAAYSRAARSISQSSVDVVELIRKVKRKKLPESVRHFPRN